MTVLRYCCCKPYRLFQLACILLLAALFTHLVTQPAFAAGCQPANGEVVIWAAYIDTWLPVTDPLQGTDETDEAIALINLSPKPVDVGGCALQDKGNHRALFPAYTVPPQSIIWAARDGEMFKTMFGFWPTFDYDADPLSAAEQANGVLKMSLTGSAAGPLALSNGTETISLRAQDGRLLDVLPYGKSNSYSDPQQWPQAGGVAPSAGYGPIINNIPRFSLFQIISRKTDGCTGLPVADTNTPADWATDPNDDVAGRRFFRPGQDLPRYALPLQVNEAVTKLKFLVSPDNSFAEFYAELNSAAKSIKIGGYEYAHPDLIKLLIDKAATLPVQILFEYQPTEGLDTEQKYLCQELAKRGNGSGCTWINDSFASTTSGPFGVTRGLIGRYRFHHAKYTLLDDKTVLVGTENPNRSSIPFETKPANGASGNRGVYIVTDAPSVVQHFVTLFATDSDLANHFDVRTWSSAIITDTPPANFALPPLGGADRTGYTIVKPQALALPAGVYELEVLQSPDNVLTTCTQPGKERGLLGMVARAGAGDWVLVAQNTEDRQWGSSSTPRPNPRLAAYLAAAQRGAAVRVILDGNPLNQATCDYLNSQPITGGGTIACRKGNPTGGTYHIKEVAVCAGGQGFVNISSVNGTENSHKQNRETGLQVRSAIAFQYMADLFAADWAKVGGDPLTIQCAGVAAAPTATATATATPAATATLLPPPTATPMPTVAATATATAMPTSTATPVRDDLTRIRGIGPTYAGRLYAAGVYTFAHLARLTPAEIKAIVAPGSTGNFIDADSWIAQAQTLAGSK